MIAPTPVIPRHVAACIHSPLKLERWAVWTWKLDEPGRQHRVPYQCGSWRCEVCRRHEASVTFARIRDAVMAPAPDELVVPLDELGRVCGEPWLEASDGEPAADPRGWVFLVLTLDRDGYFSGAPWTDVNEAYRQISTQTSKLLKRIGREWGHHTRVERSGRSGELRTARYLGNRWVAVVEAHRSGWPHVNLMLWCPELAAELERDQRERLEDPELADAVALAQDAWRKKEPIPREIRERARRAALVGGRLAQIVTETGWGLQSTAERARDIEAVIGYGVKLAGLHDASVGELAKITQCPMNAPERFRRFRCGKGFLAPRHTDPSVTGCLVRRARSAQGDWEIRAVNAPNDERWAEPVTAAIRAEHALIDEEERLLSLGVRVPERAPLRVAVDGKLAAHREIRPGRAPPLTRAGPIGVSPEEHEAMFARVRAERAASLSGAA